MKIIIQEFSKREPNPALFRMALIQLIERKVSEQYVVYPVRSSSAFELFDLDGGGQGRVNHVTLQFEYEGRLDDINVCRKLAAEMIKHVQSMWPCGSTVVWRLYPEFKE